MATSWYERLTVADRSFFVFEGPHTHMHVGGTSIFEMIDDVRLAVEGRTRVVGIGGISHDHSGFGVGPLLEPANAVERLRRAYGTEATA